MESPLRIAVACGALVVIAPGSRLAAEEPTQPASPVPPPESKGKAEHVVVMVWDGLRPDCVNDQATPTLAKLAREGVTFARHHSVYPTSTEVNGTALATGCYPARNGIIGNREYRPAIHSLKTVATEALDTIRKGDVVSGGKYIAVPTVAELVQETGERTAVAGTKPVAMLQDRAERRESDAARRSVTLVGGAALPIAALESPLNALGVFPPTVSFPNVDADSWTTKALTSALWKDGLPKFSVLWLSDPDFSQHQTGVGSATSLGGLASNDQNLATVLAALDQGGWRDKTDVFVVSDHGFSTIAQPLDVAAALVKAGFSAAREYKTPPKPGDILVDSLGGSDYFYVAEHHEETIRRLVDFLQGTDFAGVIFTRRAMPGTFPLDAIRIDSPDAPDIALSLRWTDEKNAAGFPGLSASDGTRKPGQGTHASLSRYDAHNTLIAAGPDLRRGVTDDLPSSNADVAPTIARILGLKPAQPMDGRVLREALVNEKIEEAFAPKDELMEAVRETDHLRWRQFLQVTRYGNALYFNEGNGASTRK